MAHEAQVLLLVKYCAVPQAVQVLGLLAKHLTQLELQGTQVWLLPVLLPDNANPNGQYLQFWALLHVVFGTQFWRADELGLNPNAQLRQFMGLPWQVAQGLAQGKVQVKLVVSW